MRILVTGGAGFVGSHLCARLVASGHAVTALDAFRPCSWPDKDPSSAPSLSYRTRELLAGTDIIRFDLVSAERLPALLEDHRPDCVVHLAGQAVVAAVERDPEQGAADILQSTTNLLAAVRGQSSVGRFVFVSSSMVYGNFTAPEVTEEASTRPVNIYGALKLAGETLTRAYLHNSHVEHVIVRPTGLYGPGEVGRRVVQVFCERALAGLPLTVNRGPDSRIDFTWVEDLARGIARCCHAPEAAGETFNLSFGRARELGELVDVIRSHIPELRATTRFVAGTLRPRRGSLSNAKARRLLGFDPRVDLESGVARYLQHLRELRGAAGPLYPLQRAQVASG